MDKSEARAILVNAQMYSLEQIAEATRIQYPNTTSMRPPRPPPDNTPSASEICRYPKMYANRPEQYQAALREVLGEIVPPAGLDVTSPAGAAKWAELKIAAEKAGLDAGAVSNFLAHLTQGAK